MTFAWNMSGTISARPPRLIAMITRIDIRPMFFSRVECFIMIGSSGGHGGWNRGNRRPVARQRPCLPAVVGHDEHAEQHEYTAEQARDVIRMRVRYRLDERVGQRAVRIRCPPHQ